MSTATMQPTPDAARNCDQHVAMLSPLVDADPARPFVVAQLGQSLDGRIATPTGESRWINKDAALDHVHRIRANVDAVLVGVGTVAADDPILNVRRVPGRNPARVVIDPNGRITGVTAPALPEGVEVLSVPLSPDGKLDPNVTVAALFASGLRKLLIEGGAWTVSEFINARAVDRLHVLVAPVILGSGKAGLSLKPIDRLSEALRPTARIFPLADGDVLFDCDLRA
jgi:diaminohydroxyphosphoribosylaminopyrimidine deaminase / 5-amino-6-(5-phosphoribosylamino)uracil reductase